MESLTLQAARLARGEITLPGSKSISNRTLLLAALASGTTDIHDLLASDDTDRMLDALKLLGVSLTQTGEHDWKVVGCAGVFTNKQAELFLGNAGTAFRPLTAALALSQGDYKLSGVARMHERPIGDLVDALRQAGASIDYLGNDGYPPLHIKFATVNNTKAIKIKGNVSSQFLTALLMALPLTGEQFSIEVVGELISKPYIEITLNLMAQFGVVVTRDGWERFTIPAKSSYTSPGKVFVEGDASSASYFLAAGGMASGPLRVHGIGKNSIQGDVKFADALALMGVNITYGDNWIESSAPVSKLKAIDLDCNHIPDAAMTLAIAALFADGTTTLRNVASWRVKETDRLNAMAIELRKLGAMVEEGADYISVTPPAQLSPYASIDTYDDHRMAMCFSLASLANTPVIINDPKCVAKTFPDYFEQFSRIVKLPTPPVVAIDGPSASGKGTVAQIVAKMLGYHYLDSGALYRIVAYASQNQGISWQDEAALAAMASQLDIKFDENEIYLNGEIISEAVRTEEIGKGASQVAVHPAVRSALNDLQHSFRKTPGLVADGRDMATVVFTDGFTKIYLTASTEIRAERRYKQLIAKGQEANYEEILNDLHQRDERDQQRTAAPLKMAKDAILLETDNLSIEKAVEIAIKSIKSLANTKI